VITPGSDGHPCSIAIVTFADDLHALVIQDRLRSMPDTQCVIIEVDRLSDHAHGLSWRAPVERPRFTMPTRDGDRLDATSLDAIWFRRSNHPQRDLPPLADVAHAEVVNRSCATTLLGGLLTSFAGAWVSRPEATSSAENKLVQLQAAQAAGFSIPRTLVSQDPQAIRTFCAELPGAAVIKTVRGTPHSQLFTVRVTQDHLADEDALRICPTIFQEYVPGSRHLRVLCCGSRAYAVMIKTERLDWRLDLDTPIMPVQLETNLERRLADVLERLGLRMGVADLKITPDGDPVWLELNPQGQFLFIEGLTSMDLTGPFCDFLREEAANDQRSRRIRIGRSRSPHT
jgi:glutathione synthase/RimK-type ligase-like ATP-grasp enzyme